MKKMLLFILLSSCFIYAQTPIYKFGFNSNVSDETNVNVNFVSSATNNTNYYTVDRFGNENAALSAFINNAVNYTANLPNIPLGNTPRSVSIWVSYQGFNVLPAQVDIFNYGNQSNNQRFGLRQLSNSIRAYGWSSDLDTPSNERFEFNNIEQSWYHYVMTFDGSNVKVYRNGHLVLSGSKPEWNTNGSQFRLNVGSPTTAGAGVSFDDLEIYDVVLTESQIKSMYIQQAGTTLLDDLVAYFSFDENLSSQDNTHHFTLGHPSHTLPAQTTGYFGSAYSFNNSMLENQSLSNQINTDNVSFSFWSKRTDNQTSNVSLVGFFNGFNFIRNTNNQNNVLLTHGSSANNELVSYASPFPEDIMGEWVHHAVVFSKPSANSENREFRYYNNGVLVRTLTVSNPMFKHNNAVTLGRTYNNTGVGLNNFFTALSGTTLDELLVFNKALTQTEILALSFMNAEALSGSSCPTGDVTITSQAEADALAGCTHIMGDLTIQMAMGGEPLDFTPLNEITIIDGSLTIVDVNNTGTWQIFPNLNSVGGAIQFNRVGATNIAGFSGITSLQSLAFGYSNNLTSISGFQNLQSISPGSIELFVCPNLENIQPFAQLTSFEKMQVAFCDELTNLNFLSNVNTVSTTTPFRYINLISNAKLADISGLAGVTGQPVTHFKIEDNPLLSTCAVNWVCSLLTSLSASNIVITGNATGCESLAVVNATCETMSSADFIIDVINIYPNPTTTFFQIDIPNETVKEVQIFDFTGKMLSSSTKSILDVSAFASGYYMVQIQTQSGKIGRSKLIKN